VEKKKEGRGNNEKCGLGKKSKEGKVCMSGHNGGCGNEGRRDLKIKGGKGEEERKM